MSIEVQRRRGTTVAHATFTGAVGEITVDTDKNTLVVHDGATAGGFPLAPERISKGVAVESPSASEHIILFYTEYAITVAKLVAVLTGSSTPSVTWTVRFATDASAVGTEVVTGGTVTTSITSGSVVSSFSDATIPAGSFVWLETTAQSGTVSLLSVSIIYTTD